jgi:hypothetical protein
MIILTEECQWDVIGVGFLNLYRQHARLKRIFEAGAKSRAGMDTTIREKREGSIRGHRIESLGLVAWLGEASPYAAKCRGAISELGSFVRTLYKDSKVLFFALITRSQQGQRFQIGSHV